MGRFHFVSSIRTRTPSGTGVSLACGRFWLTDRTVVGLYGRTVQSETIRVTGIGDGYDVTVGRGTLADARQRRPLRPRRSPGTRSL